MWYINTETLLAKSVMLIFDWQERYLSYSITSGYDPYLIMLKIGKFDQNVCVIPNSLAEYITFMLRKKSVFVESLH